MLFAERLRRAGRHGDAIGIVSLGLMRGESALPAPLDAAFTAGLELQELREAGALLDELA